MPATPPDPSRKEEKISMRWDADHWAAWSELARGAGYDPVDYIRMMVVKAIVEADPPVLKSSKQASLQRLDRLIRKVVGIAIKMRREGGFSRDFTLHVFRRAMQDEAFVADYTAHIGGADPYVHGNPLKEVNRELGWRIKNALPEAEVVKDKDGKVVERRNLKGEVIQSYTLLKLRDEG